jgi:multiple sugar transport system permease protein
MLAHTTKAHPAPAGKEISVSQKSPGNVPIGRDTAKRSIPPPSPKPSSPVPAAPRAKHQDGEQLTAWLFSLPGLSMLTLFLIVPFLMAFYFSFTDQRLIPNPNLPTEFVGLRNYVRLFDPNSLEGPAFLRALQNNFYFAIVVVPIQSALALGLAMLVNQKLQGMNLFRTIYFTPVATMMAVVAVIWVLLYNPDGFINQFLKTISFGFLGGYNWLQDPNLAMPAVMILSIWQGVGFQMLIFLAGLQGIPGELYEAASIDGASRWRQFVSVTWPQLRNTLIFVVITTTIYAFQLFDQTQVISKSGGGIPIDSIRTVVMRMVDLGYREQSVGSASAIAVVYFILVLAISLLQRVLVREERQIS